MPIRLMHRLRGALRAVRNSLRRGQLDRELHEELQSHIEMRTAELEASGLAPAEARRRARIDFGSTEGYKERLRDERRALGLEHLLRDLVYAWRALRRSPGLVVVAMLSLGIGIGVNATLFAAVHAIFFNLPTVADPERVVGVEPGNSDQFSYPNYRDLRDRRIFTDVVGSRMSTMRLRSGETIERTSALIVTANFFTGLGVTARVGRVFTEDEASPDRDVRVAVLSHNYWMRRFQGDRAAIGRVLDLNGQPFVVLGVLPASYRPITGAIEPNLYVPVSAETLSNLQTRTNGNNLELLARLREDGTAAQAQAAVTALGQELERAYPKENAGFSRPARVSPLRGLAMRGAPQEIYLLPVMLAVFFGLLLLIACANVAGLMLARAANRRREIAVRLALGASRWRVMQAMLAESIVLALLGAAAGVVLANWVLALLGRLALPGAAAFRLVIEPDITLYLFAAGLALITGIVCGVVPAWRATRARVAAEIHHGTGGGSTPRLWLRHAFVVGQVAASLVLLVVSALLLRSLLNVAMLDPGFDLAHSLVAKVDIEPTRFKNDNASHLLFAQRVLARVEALPGVRGAALGSLVPLGGDSNHTRFTVGNSDTPGARTWINRVGPRYFETLGIPILRGRDFLPTDRAGAPPVVIVNEAFANTYFPGQDALGRRVGNRRGEPDVEIIGIARDHKVERISEDFKPVLYYPYAHHPGRVTVQVRVAGDAASAIASVTQAIRDLDPTVLVEAQTMRDATSLELTLRRAASLLLGTLGALGLFLSMIGLYGVIAYLVASRTPEIGIRMALGASAGRVRWSILRQGVRLIAIGITIGGGVALLLMRPLSAILAGLSPADPLAFGSTALAVLVVGVAAIWLPARRATRVDPTIALRTQ